MRSRSGFELALLGVSAARLRREQNGSSGHPRGLPAYRLFELSRIGVALPHDDLAVLEAKYVDELRVDRSTGGLVRSTIAAAGTHHFSGSQNLLGRRCKPVPFRVH